MAMIPAEPLVKIPYALPDSLMRDTVVAGEQMRGFVLQAPASLAPQMAAAESSGLSEMSWVYLVFALLFVLAAFRFRKSPRYFKAQFSDLVDTRMRQNLFDDTVSETSLTLILQVIWACSVGVFLWIWVRIAASNPAWSLSVPDTPARGIGICAAVALIYEMAMQLAYWVVGNVFTDRERTASWLRGARAQNSLECIPFLPLALLAISYPEWQYWIAIASLSVFVAGKFVFIYKGFRIFFTKLSSWLLFLYYLCSLEIVPLLISGIAAILLCGVLLQ